MNNLELQKKIKEFKLSDAMLENMTQVEATMWFKALGVDWAIKQDQLQVLKDARDALKED